MRGLDFYAEVLCSGTVLGLDAHSAPEEVTAVLGEEFGEHRTRRAMVRDFGLVEFSWERTSAERPWQALGFAVQPHRLETAAPELAGPALRAAYGAFTAAPPRLADVRALLDPQLWPLDELPFPEVEFRQVWQPLSGSVVLLGPRKDARTAPLDTLPVYRIGAPHARGRAALRATAAPSERSPALDRLDHLLALPPEARSGWFARRGPGSDEDRVNWWLHHSQVVDARISERRERQGGWIELRLWLLEEGRRRSLFTAAATAESRAHFVATLHASHAPLPGDVTVPDADALVRDCLAAISGTPETLARRADLHAHSRDELLRSRRARNLVRAAEQHRARVRDPELAARLDEWARVRAELV